MREIQSANGAIMQNGLKQLEHDPAMLKNPLVMTKLAKIFNYETKILDAALTGKIKPRNGRYAGRYQEMLDILFKYGNLNDPYIFKSLLHCGFNAESKMAYILAGQGERGFKYVMQLYHETLMISNESAIGIISYMLQRYDKNNLKYPLNQKQIQILKAIMVRSLKGNDYGNLLTAVHYYQAAGNKNIMPELFNLEHRHYCGCRILEDYLLCNELEKTRQMIDQRAVRP